MGRRVKASVTEHDIGRMGLKWRKLALRNVVNVGLKRFYYDIQLPVSNLNLSSWTMTGMEAYGPTKQRFDPVN